MSAPRLIGMTWYLMDRVPKDISSKARGQSVALEVDGERRSLTLGEFAKLSLKTKDAAQAKRRYHEAAAALSRHYETLRQGPKAITQQQAAALAGDYFRSLLQRHGENPGVAGQWVDGMDPLIAAAEDDEANATRRLRLLEGMHGDELDHWLAQRGISLDPASREAALQEFNRAAMDAFAVIAKRANGDWRDDVRAGRYPQWMPSEEPVVKCKTANSLRELSEEWAKSHEVSGGRLKTRKALMAMVEVFIAFVGHADATKITYEDALAWAKSMRDGDKPKAVRTINDTYLPHLSAVLNQPAAKRMLNGHNPFAGAKVGGGRQIITRDRGFTDDEALTVLRAAFAVSLDGAKGHQQKARAQRWLAPIMAHTGARVGELAQLRKEDFKRSDDVHWIRITPEAGSTKTGIFRDVPLHPQLLDWGLLKWIDSLPDGPIFYTPSGVSRDKDHSRQSRAAQHAAALVRDAGVTDVEQPNHGWRHYWKTMARDVGIGETWQKAILGHKDKDVASGYGSFRVETKFGWITCMPPFKL
ncbi:tyrosine-type recombinase/integrase [Loktanella sp. SALINAS62]|uniref:tyrosine-type recombinase/integrase n=1 Tax=Loktanella sp. SALINAS62 TaxID=2706124 RepID=UPI001B8DA95B|nr:tyrosine-type recombinase/integrase [Loktanella sp. SALINAS62]MBS1304298.1 tyrosine-type recombinase/integrase [Loktanella sp. SALINAS62]